ncbi:DUF1259 domain-containing protein [Bacillus sp. FSL K6-3431]|uniref:DUF1259 domain-containing protein n=1 Tax=Bacillus sp. FSL K6-3431 TaxID=2921500 RepID=UPI0030F7D1BD
MIVDVHPDNQCDIPVNNDPSLCEQFARILKGTSKIEKGVCSVSMHRNINVIIQGRPSTTVIPVGVLYESLDHNGNSLNLAEIAILQEEIPAFMQAVTQQGIIVSALHNHWLYMKPMIMYIHLQSIEPPLNFAHKIAYAFSFLSSAPLK